VLKKEEKRVFAFTMCVQYALHTAYSHALHSTIWEKQLPDLDKEFSCIAQNTPTTITE
jgi:hypothetical protein